MNSFVTAATAAPKKPRVVKPKAPAPLVSKVDTTTANGAKSRSTSGQAHVDLFAIAGSARNDQSGFLKLFERAYQVDKSTALRIALWTRDVRGGAGERQSFRTVLKFLENKDPVVLQNLVPHVPEFGRWDDVIDTVAQGSNAFAIASQNLKAAIDGGNGLAAKWTPRKGDVAVTLRKVWGMTPKQYRKFVVTHTDVVETLMCDKRFDEIKFDKIPSLASLRYQKAFGKRAPAAYAAYKSALEKGEVKVNASALFPHDIVTNIRPSNGDSVVLNAQWAALPDYLEGKHGSMLVLSDVSSSMYDDVGGGVSAMNVSIALGLYISERQSGPFKDLVLTFADDSNFHKVVGANITERCNNLRRAHWGGSTNFQSSFDSILKLAVQNRVPAADMPKTLLVLSDMEFNNSSVRGRSVENFKAAEAKFAAAGYAMPKVVFWNVNGKAGNNPVSFDQTGTMMVSGYSPSVLKAVMTGAEIEDVTPMDVMMEAVMNPRYDVVDQIV